MNVFGSRNWRRPRSSSVVRGEKWHPNQLEKGDDRISSDGERKATRGDESSRGTNRL